MEDFQSSQTAEQIETVLVGAITPTRGRSLTEAEKQVARDYIGATAFGDGIKVLAHFDTFDELVSVVTKPAAGDSYSVGEQLPYRRYAYDFYHNEWRDYGPIRSEDISARLATNLLVLADEWIEDNTVFENYTFRASLPLGEITGNDFASVVFAPADAAGGNFCPVAFAFDGYVEIWANSRPDKETIVKSVTFITITDSGEGNNTAGITNATGVISAGSVTAATIADEAITVPKINIAARTQYFDITLADDGWKGIGAPWMQTIEIADLPADSEPVVILNSGDTNEEITAAFAALEFAASAGVLNIKTSLETKVDIEIRISFSVVDSDTGTTVEQEAIATVLAADWIGSAPYEQKIEKEGILEKDKPKVFFAPPESFDLLEEQQDAYSLLYDVESADGSVTLFAKEMPETTVSVTLEVSRI